mgnify:CR=1 FL=1
MKLRLVITVTLLLLVGIFVVQNAVTVEVRLLFWRIEMPRALLIFMTLLIGAVVGWSARAMYRIARTGDK